MYERGVHVQLLGTPSPVLLYCLPGAAPALHAAVELQRAPSRRYNAYFFNHLVVALRPLAVRLEERYEARVTCVVSSRVYRYVCFV